ncbi:hypothetical protein Lal_00027117 [Lupinus albus]|nr:hypothetical protein Lal_00027117 [Lupinus albus]
MFHIRPGEKILNLQKRFTHLTNYDTLRIYLGASLERDVARLGEGECVDTKGSLLEREHQI